MDDFPNRYPQDGVAIIGMAGRFPGAATIDQLWRNLCEGVESITFFSEDELDPSIDPVLKNKPNYVRARGILEDADKFDAAFFGITPREAEIMDPQHRVFLEASWQALENAGYNPDSYDGLIAVYGGTGFNTYFTNHVSRRPDLIEAFGEHQTSIANAPDYLATRVSYKLNLRGPSISLYTGCSLSLVAVCQAFDGLMSYQCDMALAGGAFVACPQNSGYLHQEGEIFSADGHCRSFDARAQGTVFGNGVCIAVLKRLEDASKDGDSIYGVIRGTALNNDGSMKVSFTAPSVDGQAEVIAMAHANADVDPETISYIETHGTATPVGDPIEIAALTQAFRARTSAKNFCAIGSIKANVGHLDAAAGVAGLIKTTLMLNHKVLPPSINFEEPNPEIDFPNSPFYVNTKLLEWETDGAPRRAGVSSFGVGGTNAHVILEEAPVREASGLSRSWTLLLLSAKTSTALDTMTTNLADHLRQHPDLNLADVAYTLQVGRKAFKHRRMTVCESLDDAVATLQTLDPKSVITSSQESIDRQVVFMFSGQASQYVNMGLELYRTESLFREEIDRCSEILEPHLGLNLRDTLYPDEKHVEEAGEKLEQTSITQPALFTIEYALAKLWMSWGVQPAALAGHSIGEYVAACLAGVFSLEDALSLVATRGRLMQKLPGGSMLAVFLSEKEIAPFLGDDLSLAVINGPSICAVSGDHDAIEDLEKQLSQKGVDFRRLHTSHAFHSKMMDPIVDSFAEQVNKVKVNPPQIPFLSNLTGTWIRTEEATNPGYWAKHLRQTVRFSDCVQELLKEPTRVLLEVGPGITLSTLVSQHPDKKTEQFVVSSIRHPNEQKSDIAFILNTLGRLWLAGIQVDWAGFCSNENRHRLPLPTYPFERRRHWINTRKQVYGTTSIAPNSSEEIETTPPSNQIYSEQKIDTTYMDTSRYDTEQIITNLWEKTLGIDHIGTNDNFFELGGNSLIAVRLFAQIQKIFGKRLPLATLYKAPTVRQLSDLLNQKELIPSWSPLVEIQTGGYKPPLFFMHAEGGNVLEYQPLAKHLGKDQPFYGLQAQGLEGKEIVVHTIEEMAAHYIKEIKTVQPKGPYYIGGYCLGGLVAFEMAQQLQAEGEQVAFLALISTSTPAQLRNIKPNSNIFVRLIYRILERIELELNNLSVLERKAKLSYIFQRIDRMLQKSQFRSEDLFDRLFSLFHLKYKWHSRVYLLEKSVELTDDAYMEYRPKPLRNRILLFRVSKQERELTFDPTLGWRDLAEDGVHDYEVHGFHKNILREPNVRALAEKLRHCLKQAQTAETHEKKTKKHFG